MGEPLSRLLPRFVREKLQSRHSLRKVAENTGWLFFEKAFKLVFGFFIAVLMARYMGPERYGIIRYAISLFSLLGLLSQLGLQGIVVRDIVKSPEDKFQTIGSAFFLKLIGSALSFAVLYFVAHASKRGDRIERMIILVIGAGLLLRPLETVNFWYESQIQSKYIVFMDTIAFIIAYILRLVLVFLKAPLIHFAYAILLEIVLSALFAAIVYIKKEGSLFLWRINLPRALELISQSWMLLMSGFLAQVFLKIDQVMLRLLVGAGEVGIYSVAVTISETWYFFPNALVASVFPKLVEQRKTDMERYSKNLQRVFDILFLLALSLAVPISFLANPIIIRLYGEAYQKAGGILTIHIWAGIFIFMRSLFSRWLIAEGLLSYSFVSNLFGAVSNVLINLLLIKPMGGIGAAVATLASYAIASYFALFFMRKTRGIAKMMTLSLILPYRLIKEKGRIWRY